MKVLLANPPAYIGNNSRHFIHAGSRWPASIPIPKGACKTHFQPYPFYMGYSSSLLKRETNAKVRVIDACALDFDEGEFFNYVKSFSPDIIFFEAPTISFDLLMPVMRTIKKDIDCMVGVAGSHVTGLTHEVMKKYDFIDFCFLGEYELTLNKFVQALEAEEINREIKEIGGLAFRSGNKIVINERQELLNDLDYLPFPDRDSLPLEHYHDFGIGGEPCAIMLSSRGCPHNCIFCIERNVIYSSPLYRKRRPSKIVDEMILLKEKYGAKSVYFDDQSMVVDKGQVRSICTEIVNRRLDLPWTCMADATVDYETLRLMARAGCVGLKFGVESISTNTLASIKKTFVSLERIKRLVAWCKEFDIWTHATYMVGLPSDTKKDLFRTLMFAIRLDTDSAQFSMATPFPGTPFFEIAKRNNWLVTSDWLKYDGAHYSVLSYPGLTSRDIERLFTLMLLSFWLFKFIGFHRKSGAIEKDDIKYNAFRVMRLLKSILLPKTRVE